MNLLNYLPESYGSSEETVDLLSVMGWQTDRLYDRYLDFLNQLQVCTASWGLSFWEQIYGIPVDVSKPEQERREVLYSKMRAIGSVTPESIRSIAAAFSEGETVLKEHFGEYRFSLILERRIESGEIGEGLKKAMEEMKPAHLAWDYYIQMIVPQKALHIAGGSYCITETVLPPMEGEGT